MKRYFPVTKESWYTNPSMLGHHEAIKMVNKTMNLFRKISSNAISMLMQCININELDWHYWFSLTNKYLRQIQHVGLQIDKQTCLNLLNWLNKNSGVLKTRLDWYLEQRAYTENQSEYLTQYCNSLLLFGLSKRQSEKRFHKYHKRLLRKNLVDF